MGKAAVRAWYLALGIVSVVVTVAVSGAMAALIHALGFWAYPVSFAMYIGAFAIVYVFLLPTDRAAASGGLVRYFGMDHGRFERGIWPWVMRRGTPFFVGAATVALGPFFGAVLVRFLGVPDRKAWRYALVASIVSVTMWVSIYLGFMDWLSSLSE